MERLRASDLEGALGFVHEAAAESGPDPFPVHVVARLRTLVGCEFATYCELNRSDKEILAMVEAPVPEPVGDDEAVFWRIVEHHPLCRAQRLGRFDALKISDFHTPRQFHRTDVYADWLRPGSIEYQLEVSIPSAFEHTKTFLFDDGRRDFTERDRALLNLLQPHLVQLYRAAEIRRFVDSARAVLEDGRDLGDRALMIVNARGVIEAGTPLAWRLLADYGAQRTLIEWLEEARAGGGAAPLRVGGPSGTLFAELDRRGAAEVVLLEERTATGALTRRELEVLRLVADGLRNAEIAEALWLSPATVRKHLENIYEKLGVHTRTAAVAHLRG